MADDIFGYDDDFDYFAHLWKPEEHDGWMAELEQAFAHCAWVSDWGPECVRFAQGAGLDGAALAAP